MTTTRDPTQTEPPGDASTPLRRGPALWQVVVIAVAIAVIGGAVGVYITRPTHPAAASVDTQFLTAMTVHHNQAIAIAFTYLQNGGDDPLLQHMAREIITSQGAEIGWMNLLLDQWGHGSATPPSDMSWMGMRGAMPGLAIPAELDQLKGAHGTALNDQFTKLMIRHHEGGLHMADYAAQHAESGDLRSRARSMAAGQASEIAEINSMRRQLGLQTID
jgi:uncharacterized protein (DUF305 family)